MCTFYDMTEEHSVTNLTKDHDVFFIFDFSARYAVQRCGANDTMDIAIMSVFIVLPFVVWIVLQAVTLLRGTELYIILSRWTISGLTGLQLVFLYSMQVPPPVLGCGPRSSHPNPNTALCAYLLVTCCAYVRDFKHGNHSVWIYMLIPVFVSVVHSVLAVGFGDAAACVAGSILGTVVASSFHRSIVYLCTSQQQLLSRWRVFTKEKLGIDLENNMITEQLLCDHNLAGNLAQGQSGGTHTPRYITPNNISPAYRPLCRGYQT